MHMYEQFFGFTGRPFLPNPQPLRYFAAESVESSRQALARCLSRGEGIGLLVGPTGVGKSMVCNMLDSQLRSEHKVALFQSGRLADRLSLYRTTMHSLNLDFHGRDESELRLELLDFVEKQQPTGSGLVMIFDEAHSLTLSLLEEIRMLTNLGGLNGPAFRVLLCGASILEERLTVPKLEPLSQRITTRCYLETFTRKETYGLIQSQLQAVGATNSALFADDACDAVFEATQGIARLIGQLCDRTLCLAAERNSNQIDVSIVELAWAHLQQLPTPESDECPELQALASQDVIEYGSLDGGDFSGSHGTAKTNSASFEFPTVKFKRGVEVQELPSLETHSVELVETSSSLECEEPPVEAVAVSQSQPLSKNPFAEEFDEEEVIATLPLAEPGIASPMQQEENEKQFQTISFEQAKRSYELASKEITTEEFEVVALEPEVEVVALEPEVEVAALESEVEVVALEPEVEVVDLEPEVEVAQSEMKPAPSQEAAVANIEEVLLDTNNTTTFDVDMTTSFQVFSGIDIGRVG